MFLWIFFGFCCWKDDEEEEEEEKEEEEEDDEKILFTVFARDSFVSME